MEQLSFGGKIPPIVSANEPHMALLFLLDTSGSMAYSPTGESPIEALNKAVNRFKDDVCKDEQTKDILDVAIVEFNSGYRIVQEFTPVEYMSPVNLTVEGATYISKPLETCLDMVTERSRFYRKTSTEPYKPWIIIATDGLAMDEPDEIEAISQKARQMTESGKVSIWGLASGEATEDVGALNMLHKICDKRVLKLEGCNFNDFFDWANKSMRAVSQSSPGEKVKGQELPPTVTIDDLM